jgi:hypothetical protein
MLEQSAALRREIEAIPQVEEIEYDGVPNHFEYAPLDVQLGRLLDAHKESKLDPKPFERFLSSRNWDVTQLSNGRAGLAVVPWDSKVGPTYHQATITMMQRFRSVRQPLALTRSTSLSDPFWRDDDTSRRMALVRQWHNTDLFERLDFLLLLVRLGPEKDRPIGEVNVGEFQAIRWFDMSLFEGLNILLANPGRLDSSRDTGLDFAGDHWGHHLMPTLSVENRHLTLGSRKSKEPHARFWRAQVALLK